MPNNSGELITLSKADVKEAAELAQQTYERWKSFPGYYRNSYNSHFKGKLGEIAVEKYLRSKSTAFQSYFRSNATQGLCDVEASGKAHKVRIEVKTWSLQHWAADGRCVKPEQVAKLQTSADVIVWCIVPLKDIGSEAEALRLPGTQITVRGWSTIAEIAATSTRLTGRTQINNHQVDDDQIHAMDTLEL